MSPSPTPAADGDTAEYVAFEDFREGLPLGRFRVIVNPTLAHPFVAQRVNATPLAIALIGPGIACAVGGYVWTGAALVAAGILLRRVVRWQAGKILLHLAARQASTYHEATSQGVMEVQRVTG